MLWSSLPPDRPGVLQQAGAMYYSGSCSRALPAQTTTCLNSTSAVKQSGEVKRKRASHAQKVLAH